MITFGALIVVALSLDDFGQYMDTGVPVSIFFTLPNFDVQIPMNSILKLFSSSFQ